MKGEKGIFLFLGVTDVGGRVGAERPTCLTPNIEGALKVRHSAASSGFVSALLAAFQCPKHLTVVALASFLLR